MAIVSDQGIVLKGTKLGEADKILDILTSGRGLVRAIARGIRKPGSRFGARLEPATLVDIRLYEGRRLDTISAAEIVEAYRGLRADYDAFAAAMVLCEAAASIAAEGERNPALFLLLRRGLRALDGGAEPTMLTSAFLLQLLRISGFAPALDACVVTGAREALHWFDVSAGGVVSAPARRPQSFRLREGTRETLDAWLLADLSALSTVTAPVAAEAGALVRRLVEHHLERRLRSLAVSP